MRLSTSLRITGVSLLLAVLAVGPVFRGLFFWTELLTAIALIAGGFGLWLLGRRLGGLPSGLSGGWAGLSLLALTGLYTLQFDWAVFPRGNLDWTLRLAAAWFTYTMLRAEAGPRLRQWLGWVFVLSAAGVGVLGFLEYTGYLFKDPEVARALSLVGLQTRMFTTMQYPNTAAVYFLAAMLAAMGLGLEELKPWKLAVTGALSTFLALAFFFTISRGALVALPFGLVIFLAGLGRDRLWPALVLLAGATVPLLAVIKPVGAASAAKQTADVFQWLAVAAAGGAVCGLVAGAFLRLKGRVQALVAALVLVAAMGGAVALKPAGGYLPKQAERLLDINFKTVNVVLRLIYDQDAMRMAADRPLGRGGWGWDRGYRQYQTFNYTARETHNHYAQTAVEAGWAGLGALVAALGAAAWTAWRNRRANALGWSLASGALLIAGHSAIDFNLSFGVVWLLLWALLAAAAEPVPAVAATESAAPAAPAGTTGRERAAHAVAWVAAAAVAGGAGLLAAGDRRAEQALALAEKEPERAQALARQAVSYDPLHTEALRTIGDRESLEKAVRLDPYHSGGRFKLAVALELQEDFTGALVQAKAALAAQPYVSIYWSKVATLEGALMQNAIHKGQRDEALARAKELTALGKSFTARKAVADPQQNMWYSGPKLQMAPDFKLRYGQALFLTGDKAAAEPLLKEAAKVGLLGSEAELWLYVLYEQRGDTRAKQALESKPWIRFRNQNPVYKNLKAWQ